MSEPHKTVYVGMSADLIHPGDRQLQAITKLVI
jgi:hypothetical protein